MNRHENDLLPPLWEEERTDEGDVWGDEDDIPVDIYGETDEDAQ